MLLKNSTNINKTNNHLSKESLKKVSKESLNSVVKEFHQYQQNKNHLSPKESLNSVVKEFNINLSPKESLNSVVKEFHQYQQNEQQNRISTKQTITSHLKKV